MVAVVAKGLRGLKEKVVFVGGSTIELYLAPARTGEARPTDDVDCIVELGTKRQYHDLEEELRALGFTHPLGPRAPHLIASKIEAFLDRGRNDFLGSSDIEAKLLAAPAPVRSFLAEKFRKILADPQFEEAVRGRVKSPQGGHRAIR